MFRVVSLLVVIAAQSTAAYFQSMDIETQIVQTNSGPVVGEEITLEGINYKAFKGIPYAAPPVGNLRFKAPQPPQKWTEVREAISYGKVCPQPNYNNLSSEDCLTLNVFTQSLEENNLKPVLVWIHGGSYNTGSGTDAIYGPQHLIQANIVIVTFNYRLGPLGFLVTNTSDASGNWGMKDQVAALKWVQANIARFGGDPKQVTIYGESAGGECVHLHLFSPLSKGLFEKAIMASGTAANYGVLKSPDQQERYSRNLARRLGASQDETADPHKRLQFLQAADPNEMVTHIDDILDKEDFSNPMINPTPFSPVIERFGTEGAFLTENPMELLAAGNFTKVPMVMGLTDLEGGLLYMIELSEKFTLESRKEIEKKVCQILPESWREKAIVSNECTKIAQQMRDVYFNGKGLESSLLNFVYLWGDLFESKDIYFSQRIHARFAGKENPLYNYYFTFDGKWNMLKKAYDIPLPGAAHGDDLMYVFQPRIFQKPVLPESSPEVITKNRMISLITNFVRDGNPTPSISDLVPVKWLPSGKDDFSTMVIGDKLKLENEFLKSRMDLWDKLRHQYDKNSANSIKA